MTRYEELIVTNWYGNGRHEIHVDQAPDVALCSVELLQHMHTWYFAGPDRINVGIDLTTRPPTREPVWYQITDWDPDHKALVLTRISEPTAPSTSEAAHGYTGHGHTCCGKAPAERPAHIQAIAKCGGPGMCQQCADDRDQIHTGRQKP